MQYMGLYHRGNGVIGSAEGPQTLVRRMGAPPDPIFASLEAGMRPELSVCIDASSPAEAHEKLIDLIRSMESS